MRLTTPSPHPLPQACHTVVKRAWERTTRTFVRKQRRPSYRLRQSTGASGGRARSACEMEEAEEGEAAAASDEEGMESAALPPAIVAAQHARRA